MCSSGGFRTDKPLRCVASIIFIVSCPNALFQIRHAALLASVAYLTAANPNQLSQSLSLLYPMLDTLPTLAQNLSATPSSGSSPTSNYHHLSTFLSALTPLCATHPTLFAPHLPLLLSFLPNLILLQADCGPTPMVGRPFPGNGHGGGGGQRQGAFVFPPLGEASSSSGGSPSASSATTHLLDFPLICWRSE